MLYLTFDHLSDLKGFARRFWREVFHRLGQDAVLVLDNCQDAASETFHTILREGFVETPAGVTVIGISRSRLGPEFSRLVANQVIVEVGSSDLRLTEAEASQIASYAGIADDAKVSRLYRASAGWTAGLVLLLARKGDHVAESGVAHESKEALFNYLAEEVYRQMDARTQSILIRTALLPQVSAAMAAELCADPDAASVLEELYRKQYFVDRPWTCLIEEQEQALAKHRLMQPGTREFGEV